MLAFFLTLFLGIGEMLLLSTVLKNALAGDMKKTLIFILIKLLLYAAVITTVVLLPKTSLVPAAVGFCIGLPGAAIVYTVVTVKKKSSVKGDDGVENGTDN